MEKYRSMTKEERMAIPFIGLSRVEFKNNYNNSNSRGPADYSEDLPAS